MTDRFHPNSARNRTPIAVASARVRNSRCHVARSPDLVIAAL
ncbi:MAG TPA: hypothetical protein VMI73_16760 [Trebonia sp.]|nr:hypothetical protein [Trebonia sp.]